MRQFDMETSVPLDFLGELRRTHMCGALRASDVGKNVVLMGWVQVRRDHGRVIFVDLRDREGITQVVFHEDLTPEVHDRAEMVRPEYVIAVEGKAEPRSAANVNPNLATNLKAYVTDNLFQPLVWEQVKAVVITIILSVVGTVVITAFVSVGAAAMVSPSLAISRSLSIHCESVLARSSRCKRSRSDRRTASVSVSPVRLATWRASW